MTRDELADLVEAAGITAEWEHEGYYSAYEMAEQIWELLDARGYKIVEKS